jgi:hypothetical protein
MTSLVDRVLVIAAALDDSGIDWAPGSALARAFATEEPRGTRDIDVNVFVLSAQVATRTRRVPFAGSHVNVLSAEDLAVFKALFDRSRDWVDIDEMAAAGALDREVAAERLASLLDPDDPRIARLVATGK